MCDLGWVGSGLALLAGRDCCFDIYTLAIVWNLLDLYTCLVTRVIRKKRKSVGEVSSAWCDLVDCMRATHSTSVIVTLVHELK